MSKLDSEAQALAEACVMITDYFFAANARERGWRNVGGELWLQVETVRAHRKTIKKALSWAETTVRNLVGTEQPATPSPVLEIANKIITDEHSYRRTSDASKLVQRP